MATATSSPDDAFIGVDVGGTHTDVAAIVAGRVECGKALTTYDEFSRGVVPPAPRATVAGTAAS